MLRSLLKTGVALGLHATNGDRLLSRFQTRAGGFLRTPVILGYHRVVEDFPSDPRQTIPAQCVSVKMLEQQLKGQVETAFAENVPEAAESQRVFEDFIRAIETNGTPACDAREGRHSVAIVQAIYRSARDGGLHKP